MSQEDKELICYLRGFAIFTIIFGHVGGYWVFKPLSSYLHLSGSTFFFFLAGALLFHSYQRARSIHHYYSKRFINLLIPYYLICVIALFFFALSEQSLPAPDLIKFMSWLFIRPANAQMPFPLGQLWFLHTYVMLIFFSPMIFYAYQKKFVWFFLLGLVFLGLSVVKLFFNLEYSVSLLRWNLYNLSFYGLFFMAGIGSFSNREERVRLAAIIMFALALVTRALLCTTEVPLDITYNFVNRDILYIVPSVLFISTILIFRKSIHTVITRMSAIRIFLVFFHTHTFSIYLLHSLSIYFSEIFLDSVGLTERTYWYGIIKLAIVLCVVALMAIPFTRLSKAISRSIIEKVNKMPLLSLTDSGKPEQTVKDK